MKRLSIDAECKGTYTCPSVWLDDDPDFLVIVGHPTGKVAVQAGDVALRLKREIVTASGFSADGPAYRDDANPDYVVVVGEPVPAAAVKLPDGTSGVADDEIAVRVKHQVTSDVKVG